MLHNHLLMFKKRENIVEIEEGKLLSPKFDNDGLIPVITMCSKTKDVLMHGYMNVEAFKKTIETKEAHYFSRSRQQIWHKGKTSGFTQKVTEIRIDDDQDSIWLTVDIGDGSSCHVGYRSCFYRSIPLGPIENGKEVKHDFCYDKKSNNRMSCLNLSGIYDKDNTDIPLVEQMLKFWQFEESEYKDSQPEMYWSDEEKELGESIIKEYVGDNNFGSLLISDRFKSDETKLDEPDNKLC